MVDILWTPSFKHDYNKQNEFIHQYYFSGDIINGMV